ncbi:MAG: DUF4129 domain-containing protein, partial [Chloroflexota bacterium]
ALWLLMFGFLWLFDWVNRWLNDDGDDELIWRTVMVILMLIIIFPLNRMVLYSYARSPIFVPARGIFNAIFNFTDGLRPENGLLLFYIIAWVYVIWVTSNALGYIEIGRAFQLGLFVSLIGLGLLARQDGLRLGLFAPYLVIGLASLSLAQIDARIANGQHSPGRSLTVWEMAQWIAAIMLMVGLGSLVANLIAPELVRAIVQPILRFLAIAFEWIVWAMFLILTPIIRWIFTVIQSIFEGIQIDFSLSGSETSSGDSQEVDFSVVEEIIQVPQYRYLIVIIVLLFGFFILWAILNRTLLTRYVSIDESQQAEEAQPILGQLNGLGRLRDWLDRLRGRIPKSLLDPNTMENIYANLCRLADKRGYPRPVALPPDEYLSQLVAAFPGQEKPLRRITNGYMRTHYGEIQLPESDLQEMIVDYQSIVNSVEDEAKEKAED